MLKTSIQKHLSPIKHFNKATAHELFSFSELLYSSLNNTNKSSSLIDLTILMIKTSHSLEIAFLLITIDVHRLVPKKTIVDPSRRQIRIHDG